MKRAIIKQKKGYGSLEFGIGFFLLIILVAALVDLSRVLMVYDNVGNSIDYVGRVMSDQGGIGSVKPASFEGSYVTSSTLYTQVKTNFESLGIKEADWDLTVNGKPFYNGTIVAPQPYNTEIRIELNYKYRWVLLGGLISIDPTVSNSSSRLVLSDYHTRYDDIQTNIGTSY